MESLTIFVDWVKGHGWLLIGLSFGSLLASAMLLPWYVARIPEDYFSHPHRHRLSSQARHPLLQMLLVIFKNLLGGLLLIAGIIMLFTPGQGLLTLLVGLMLMNFPGKYHLERWLIARPGIWRAINWLRERQGKAALASPFES